MDIITHVHRLFHQTQHHIETGKATIQDSQRLVFVPNARRGNPKPPKVLTTNPQATTT